MLLFSTRNLRPTAFFAPGERNDQHTKYSARVILALAYRRPVFSSFGQKSDLPSPMNHHESCLRSKVSLRQDSFTDVSLRPLTVLLPFDFDVLVLPPPTFAVSKTISLYKYSLNNEACGTALVHHPLRGDLVH